jgi:hypothetical protein
MPLLKRRTMKPGELENITVKQEAGLIFLVGNERDSSVPYERRGRAISSICEGHNGY